MLRIITDRTTFHQIRLAGYQMEEANIIEKLKGCTSLKTFSSKKFYSEFSKDYSQFKNKLRILDVKKPENLKNSQPKRRRQLKMISWYYHIF